MEFNGIKAKTVFTIKAVDSIPCDIKGQILAFGEDGNLISDKIETPWPMPWITEEISALAADGSEIEGKEKMKVYNPEEPDQYVFVEISRY